MRSDITPELLLRAYAAGIFPMSEGRDAPEVFWVDPEKRGVFPIGELHLSKSLRKALRRQDFDIRVNHAFDHVVASCADRDETWINEEIQSLYSMLHLAGYAHSLEVWRDNSLIGGVYGVAINGAFFGESMFSNATNGSKIALVYLMDRLVAGGYQLFDTQFITPHLSSIGAIEIPRDTYRNQLAAALDVSADFFGLTEWHPPLQDVLQRNTHTS